MRAASPAIDVRVLISGRRAPDRELGRFSERASSDTATVPDLEPASNRPLQRAARSSEPTPLLLTITQAASLLGVSRTTAYELIAEGRLEVVHIGRCARVPADDVEEFVQRLRQQRAS